MSKRNYVSKLEDIPMKECWVLVRGASVTIPGDERSRTAPGHGYPEHTDHYVEIYEVYDDEEAFTSALAQAIKEQRFSVAVKPVRGFKLIPYTTETVVKVVVSAAKS